MNIFFLEYGKLRFERVYNFLIFVFKYDEYVIELENVLRKIKMDYLLKEKGKMEGKYIEEF